MPTTLIAFATNEEAAFTTSRTIAQAAHTAAQAATAAAQAQLDAALAVQKGLETTIAADRAKLAGTSIPAEIEALVQKLTDATVDLRQQTWKVRDAADALAAARNAQAFAEGRLQRAQAQLTVAEQMLATATEESARRAKWVTSAGQAPLQTLRQEATDLADGTGGSTLLADALAKFTTNPTRVPQELLDVAELRFDLWRARIKADRDAVAFAKAQLAAQAQADLGKPGAAQQRGIAFREAEAAFGEWVGSAKTRLDRAVSLLESIANLGANVFALTPAEAAQANDATEPQATNRTNAEDAEDDIHPAQSTVDQRQRTLDDEILKAQAVDPNKADVSNDGGVPAAITALNTAKGVLNPLLAAFDAAEKEVMAYWQVELSDQTWRRLLDFFEARAELRDLKATDPAALQTAMSTAEGLYGDALAAAAASARTIAFLEDSLALRKANAEASQGAAVTRLLGAVRGDAD
jgi:hypothetical protein